MVILLFFSYFIFTRFINSVRFQVHTRIRFKVNIVSTTFIWMKTYHGVCVRFIILVFYSFRKLNKYGRTTKPIVKRTVDFMALKIDHNFR